MHSHLSHFTTAHCLNKTCFYDMPLFHPKAMTKNSIRGSVLLALFLGVAIGDTGAAQQARPEDRWPREIPCRVHDGANPDLLIMTLGNVDTPLADGRFDPAKDQVRLKDGTVMTNYYRDILGVKFYQPLDKSRYPTPPSGWC